MVVPDYPPPQHPYLFTKREVEQRLHLENADFLDDLDDNNIPIIVLQYQPELYSYNNIEEIKDIIVSIFVSPKNSFYKYSTPNF